MYIYVNDITVCKQWAEDEDVGEADLKMIAGVMVIRARAGILDDRWFPRGGWTYMTFEV